MFRLSVLLLLPLLASAQLTPNSVTVTASRSFDIRADQFSFSITIYASPDAGLDDVLAVARDAGLTMANFSNVSYSPDDSGSSPVRWDFGLVTPFAQMKSTIGLLTALQTNLAKGGKYSLSFSMGLTFAPQPQPAEACPLADIIAEARTSATKLASAAGLTVGAIQAMSSPRFSTSPAIGGIANCAVTVRFSLGGI